MSISSLCHLSSGPHEPAGSAHSAALAFELLTFAPRILVQLAAVAALSGLFYGCVPAKQYEQAETAARQQAEARKHDREKLRSAEQRIAELSSDLERKYVAIEQGQSTLASSKLETTVALKDREAAQQMVEQLQSDLARAGDHLAWFSSEKNDLGKALLLAEQRMDDVERASAKLGDLIGVSRDLALMLGDSQSMGDLSLSAKDGVVLLEVPEARLFAEGSEALVVDAAPVLAGVARASSAHEPLKLALRPPGSAALDKARAGRLSEALAERGVTRARIAVELPEPSAAPAATPAEPAMVPAPDPAGTVAVAPATPAPLTAKSYVFAFVP
ncbi:MAG TPA: hypothetical protein VGP93_19890 [Polyangiaceae bacterium]|jgi:flagellar motor protein MotB|nr:hypothetical protein [Polyangiaceae bacterium]